jgi:hypothetical protein
MESRTHNATMTTETMAFTSENDVPSLFETKSILAADDPRGMAPYDARVKLVKVADQRWINAGLTD